MGRKADAVGNGRRFVGDWVKQVFNEDGTERSIFVSVKMFI